MSTSYKKKKRKIRRGSVFPEKAQGCISPKNKFFVLLKSWRGFIEAWFATHCNFFFLIYEMFTFKRPNLHNQLTSNNHNYQPFISGFIYHRNV